MILVVFFLPFFLVRRLQHPFARSQLTVSALLQLGMRFFGLGQAKNEVGPLTKVGIEKLPQRVFVYVLVIQSRSRRPRLTHFSNSGTVAEPTQPEGDPSKSTETLAQPATSTVTSYPKRKPARRQFWRLWKRSTVSKEKAAGTATAGLPDLPSGVEPIRLPESQTACSICLCGTHHPHFAYESAPTHRISAVHRIRGAAPSRFARGGRLGAGPAPPAPMRSRPPLGMSRRMAARERQVSDLPAPGRGAQSEEASQARSPARFGPATAAIPTASTVGLNMSLAFSPCCLLRTLCPL